MTILPGFSFPTNGDMSLGLFMFFPSVEIFEYWELTFSFNFAENMEIRVMF